VILTNVKVQRNMIGEAGKGYKIAIETLNEGRIELPHNAGACRRCFCRCVSYAKQREQFGKTISSFQSIQFELAELATQIEAAKLMVYNAARLKDANKDYVKEAAMAKYFASNVAETVASRSLKFMAAMVL